MTNVGSAAGLAFVGALMGFIVLISLVIAVICIVCYWKLFTKAGEEGWKGIIPVYNTMVMGKLAFGNTKWSYAYLTLFIAEMAINILDGIVSHFKLLMPIHLLLALLGAVVSLAFAASSCIILFFFIKSFGKNDGWCILTILFAPVMLIIMFLDQNLQYYGPSSNFGEEWLDKIYAMVKKQ